VSVLRKYVLKLSLMLLIYTLLSFPQFRFVIFLHKNHLLVILFKLNQLIIFFFKQKNLPFLFLLLLTLPSFNLPP